MSTSISVAGAKCSSSTAETNPGNGAGEDNETGLYGLVDILTSLLVTRVLPFLDFDELRSLRLMNRFLRKIVTEKELLSRSTKNMSSCVKLCNPSFAISMQIHGVWSDKHITQATVIQASLNKTQELCQETRGMVYEEGTAMTILSTGKAVTMSDFHQLQEQGAQDGEQFEDYETWRVDVPKFKKRIKGKSAWNLFKKFHFNMHLEVFPDVHAFSQILFGLLVNARVIRWNRTVKSSWETVWRGGEECVTHSDERQ